MNRSRRARASHPRRTFSSRGWFRLAAEAGIAAAQYELGVALVNGDGVAMDRREGVDWLQRAAVQGKPEAIADLETLARAGIIIMEGIEPAG